MNLIQYLSLGFILGATAGYLFSFITTGNKWFALMTLIGDAAIVVCSWVYVRTLR